MNVFAKSNSERLIQEIKSVVADAEALEAVACRAPGPPEMAAAEEGRQRLWSTAARVLSEDEVTALWLYYVEDLSAREIAAVLKGKTVAKLLVAVLRVKMLVAVRDVKSKSGSRVDKLRFTVNKPKNAGLTIKL